MPTDDGAYERMRDLLPEGWTAGRYSVVGMLLRIVATEIDRIDAEAEYLRNNSAADPTKSNGEADHD